MLQVGTILHGTYKIESYLASGGFGNTYLAKNIEFDETYAIKEFFVKGVCQRDGNSTTISVSNAENTNSFEQQREKFKKEARRLRSLSNPHIVKVYDLFEENGTAYYVMDYGGWRKSICTFEAYQYTFGRVCGSQLLESDIGWT